MLKSGWRSSEFWLALAALVLPFADTATSRIGGNAGLVASSVVAAAYAISRGYVKGKAAEAAPSMTPAAAAAAAAPSGYIVASS